MSSNHFLQEIYIERGVDAYAGALLLNDGSVPMQGSLVAPGISNPDGVLALEATGIRMGTVDTGYTLPTTRGTAGQVLMIDGSGVVSWAGP